MDPSPTTVTGATGRLGGRVARRLADQGLPQRLVVRDRSRAPLLPRATVAVAAYADAAAVQAALRGVETVLMVSGAEAPDRVTQHRTFIDAATAAGVAHIVYISFHGASPSATFTLARDHSATEAHIRASGAAFTFLRNNLYADFIPALVGDDGVIRGPAGEGKVSVVAQDDIADAATAVLRSPTDHVGMTYDLTGPEALTLHEAARMLTEVGGRRITYEPETLEQAYSSRAAYGVPSWQVDAWVSTYTAIANGELERVSADIPMLTGRPATRLIDVLRTEPPTA